MRVIKTGNTGPLIRAGVPEFDSNGEKTGNYVDLDSNYTCKISVPTNTPTLERAVTGKSQDNTRFLAQLTPAETAQLALGTHTIAVQVENATTSPPFTFEKHLSVKVERDYIS